MQAHATSRTSAWRSATAAALAMALASCVGAAQQANEADAEPARQVIGRAFPDWTGAVQIHADGTREPLEPRWAERWISHRGLVVAPRAGAEGLADREAARSFFRPDRTRGQHLRVQGAVLAAEDTPPAADDEARRVLFVPDVDALYAAPPRPWVAVHDGRGIVLEVAPLAERHRIVAALQRADRRPQVNRHVGRPIGALDALAPHDLPTTDAGEPDPTALRAPAGGLVLYRFWTDGCPHCRASLPDLAALAGRFDGLRLVPVYHQKGDVEREPKWLRDYLADLGVRGPWAQDPDWRTLRPLMERAGLRRATSVSFLVDDHGIVRWVHEGPRVHRDPDNAHEPADRDFTALERLVTRWFGARPDGR